MTSTPDILRLLVVPFFAWAAYTDVKTRRIPNKVWAPLFAAGVVLLAVTIQSTYATSSTFQLQRDLAAIAISLGVVAPVAYLFWLFGGFGGADAKALLVLALLIPIYPTYELGSFVFPVYQSPLGSFAFTILTNTVLVGVLFPLALFARNAANGEFALSMILGERVDASDLDGRYGSLMGTNDGMASGKLDLDALRMYLTWRDTSLAEIRANPARYRDPASLPAERNDPGGGEITEPTPADEDTSAPERLDSPESTDPDNPSVDAVHDQREPDSTAPTDQSDESGSTEGGDESGSTDEGGESGSKAPTDTDAEYGYDDPWGAECFLEEIEGGAYGTRPAELADGLDVVTSQETVWVSPGIPFIVPMFFGLVLALTVGDVITAALGFL